MVQQFSFEFGYPKIMVLNLVYRFIHLKIHTPLTRRTGQRRIFPIRRGKLPGHGFGLQAVSCPVMGSIRSGCG